MNEDPTLDTINEQVRNVAAHLPFPVELDADMGGTFVLQIDLGRRGRTDDPADIAGIDPEADSRWWLDIEGGMNTYISHLGLEANPAEVATWIAETALAEGCPAAVAAARTRAICRASYPIAAFVDGAGQQATQPASQGERRTAAGAYPLADVRKQRENQRDQERTWP